MKLVVYKGFSTSFLNKLKEEPLVDSPIENKKDISLLNDDYKDEIEESVIIKKYLEEAWITYEEYELAYEMINVRAKSGKISVKVINNNIYPDLYPLEYNLSEDLYNKYLIYVENTNKGKIDDDILLLDKFYSRIESIEGEYFVSYHNFESPNNPNVDFFVDYYDSNISTGITKEDSYVVDIGDDVIRYIEHLIKIEGENITNISYKMFCNTEISNLILKSLKAYVKSKDINVLNQYYGVFLNG